MYAKDSSGTIKNKELVKTIRETMMSKQSIDLLNAHDKENSKFHETLKTVSRAVDKNAEKRPAALTSALNGDTGMDATSANGFELFTRLAYCQALLYKSWIEASDMLANKLRKSTDLNHDNSKGLTSLYIDTFEETFTDLFRSPEFASNLGKLLNSLTECIKEKDGILKVSLNNLPKIPENSKMRKEQECHEVCGG